jgi:hypothetical protein
MRIMSPLLTVAMVSVVAAKAYPESSAAVRVPSRTGVSFIDFLPTSKASICFGHEQFLNISVGKSSEHRARLVRHVPQGAAAKVK